MNPINKHAVAMVVGSFLGLFHLVWAILVAMNLAKPLMDWVLHLHMMTMSYSIMPFKFSAALGLVVFTFVCGYVFGWVFAALWNTYRK